MTERSGRVEGKVAIVTGAGSTPGDGIGTGKACAVVLAREGARVLLVDLHPERAEETRQIIEKEGGKAVVFAADVTRASDCGSMVKAAVENFGTLDILVNRRRHDRGGLGPCLRHQPSDGLPGIEVRRSGDGRQGSRSHREHILDLRPPR
jgi:hypothetical protein